VTPAAAASPLVRSPARVRALGEVFTPPAVVDAMLDLLPAEVWEPDPQRTFLEPACGDGNFLVAVLDRKLDRVLAADARPERALAALASLHGMDVAPDNVRAARARLERRLLDRLARAGAPAREDVAAAARRVLADTVQVADMLPPLPGRPAGRDAVPLVAHAFAPGATPVRTTLGAVLARAAPVRFDVVVGNPPYQSGDGGAGSSARPLYHHFVRTAIALDPAHVVMVVPSRWMAGGKGLDAFRREMLADRRIRAVVDHHDPAAVFPGTNVNGGVCFVHRDRAHDGPCAFTAVHAGGRRSTRVRRLDEHDVLVRLNDALPVLAKVRARGEPSFAHRVSARRPFGLDTVFRGRPGPPPPGAVLLVGTGTWVGREELPAGAGLVDQWKVLIPRATDGNEVFPLPVLTAPVVAGPGTACHERYLVVGPFGDDAGRAERCAAYMRTRLFRFLLALRKPTQDNRADRFAFVPDVPLDRIWTDAALYARYGITPAEQAYVAEIVRAPPPAQPSSSVTGSAGRPSASGRTVAPSRRTSTAR